ncbi:MAG: mannitol dehydrogenase family protein [Acidimicrobiia bacterium]
MNPIQSITAARQNPKVASFPQYDRTALQSGILHMSVGGFHRSHQALYVHEFLQQHAEDWMIHGVGCLDSDLGLITAMRAQQNLYSLIERSGTTDTMKVIGSINEFTHAPTQTQDVIDAIASDAIRIVSLTITEKGYCYDTHGNLDRNHPLIAAELAGATPRSAIALLFAGLQSRMQRRGTPVTVMSCDNLPGNGHVTARVLLQFADAMDVDTAAWIRTNVSFPNCMVDRITPAPNETTVALARDEFGVEDPCAVASESFIQWILEDNFINGRPALETVGVQIVDDVTPYEKMKVRLLNGSHSALSYLSYLMGYREVDVAMNDPLIREFVQRYMDEDVTPSVPTVPGVDLTQYKRTLLDRFSNPAISDKIQRLAMDGSQKIPNAIVPPIEYQLTNGGSIRYLAFALAAWYRYLRAIDEEGQPIEITDPMSTELISRAKLNPDAPMHLIAVQEIFGPALSSNQTLIGAVTEALEAIDVMGTRNALTKLLN